MTQKQGKTLQKLRILAQLLFLFLFFLLLFWFGSSRSAATTLAGLFFFIDPLALGVALLAPGKVLGIFFLALLPLLLTLILGRFFCGWVCPLGTINHFFTWLFRPKAEKQKKVPLALWRSKYFILTAVAVTALFGVQLVGWLDPFSLLTRSAVAFLFPGGDFLLRQTVRAGSGGAGVLGKLLHPAYAFLHQYLFSVQPRTFTLTALIGLLFLAVIVLNAFRRRFFCNALCPLGALYGLLARFGLIRLQPGASCQGCNACAQHCPYYGSPFKDYYKSECVLCFNCVADCRFDEVFVRFTLPCREFRPALDVGRRRLISAAVSGGVLAAIPGSALFRKRKTHPFLRPPGSCREKEFLERCLRCGECLQVCPTNAIMPAFFQAGWEGLFTPIVVPANGYCEYECNKCTQVCPTAAIRKLTLEQKRKFKIGTAAINRSLCYTYADGYSCAVCEEHCPVPEKAIRLRDVEVFNYRGRLKRIKQAYVVPDLCIGCGICEKVCPRTDAPAITVGAEEEERELT